jgi:DNA-binding CsgD family transcriptional regulator
MEIRDLKYGMGMNDRFGNNPPHHSKAKTTPRDRTIMRELFREGKATRQELALAFGISARTVDIYI